MSICELNLTIINTFNLSVSDRENIQTKTNYSAADVKNSHEKQYSGLTSRLSGVIL